ncbi:GatB/YqeY domain-containing protein [Natranaerobius trueperi]|uniref:Glutamyl-tRNA amidotransferase n=1 Tax=Natranaerobius trueperi TaxID=759412 RepID=A0A226BVQ2_9FIRM|nr:GatB/YqeY domain-containing protein [Natranaerobius trueperi]OWZ83055.1 glutamyl-tRNA amidotransferase [Natranaerobius trueperi]
MEIAQRLQQDMKEAMKKKDKFRLSVIRMIRSELQNQEINNSEVLSEEDIIEILIKERKKRSDSLKEYQQAGKEDTVRDLEKEIDILDEYLPEQLSDEELESIIKDAIDKVGAKSLKEMGQVMKVVMPNVKGRADGKRVNNLVKQLLEN